MSPVTIDTDPLTRHVAEAIRVALTRRQISGRELARRLDKSQNWMNLRTTGGQSPTLSDIHIIAEALDMSPAELMGFEQSPIVCSEAREVDDIILNKEGEYEEHNVEAFQSGLGMLIGGMYATARPARRRLPPAPKEPQMTTRKVTPRSKRVS